MKVLVRGFGTLALFDDISGIAKDLGRVKALARATHLPARRQSPVPDPRRGCLPPPGGIAPANKLGLGVFRWLRRLVFLQMSYILSYSLLFCGIALQGYRIFFHLAAKM